MGDFAATDWQLVSIISATKMAATAALGIRSGAVKIGTRPDVLKLHAGMARTKSLANYTISVLSKLMSWAEEQNLRPAHKNKISDACMAHARHMAKLSI
jgi:hypothetical protein